MQQLVYWHFSFIFQVMLSVSTVFILLFKSNQSRNRDVESTKEVMLWYPVFQKLSSSQTVVFDVCLQYSSWDFNLNLIRSSYIRNFQKASVFSSYTQVYFNNHCLRTYLRSLLHAVLCNSKYIPTGRIPEFSFTTYTGS